MKGAFAAAILRSASKISLSPAIFAGSVCGPISTKSSFDSKTLRHELLFRCLIVDEHDIRIAATADIERLPGPKREHLHGDAGLRGEARKEVAKQPGLLGRRGRGDGDG